MSRIGIAGAGAFGTALAIALGLAGRNVTLWARDRAHVAEMQARRENRARLPGCALPDVVTVTGQAADLSGVDAVLLAVPMQTLSDFLATHRGALDGAPLVACSKGVDLVTMRGPTAIIADICPASIPAVLTGPSFAADIARGLPTALTLACADAEAGKRLQQLLSAPNLRLYRSADTIGAELGGALKNVVAIACGIVIGAGLGDSARAALMTRGFAEMQRLALAFGAETETLSGLSGLGDMVLTCTSAQSRNFRFGLSLGRTEEFDRTITVEGAATAKAVAMLARERGIDMPITTMVAAVIDEKCTIAEATEALLARPLKEE
ncbi:MULTISPECIES: NAD(P)H-dependent glycerol-3-phosphate dehydrogenase [Actibacterium]|uniref:Glycerol-3-phosphate dehydrogenase [NAD(P)+] n=1 Tax=Actibacterium naphthalenivorans TaxID=1614693 RepID=A0A840CED7_9RHOB|nr:MULTISPECIES: NAD(P)H-dependent glycerol-3-phosphate dehydrogenase [Actibacterium]ALG88841.1 glycerol-3-phosphate dehydrogenase [Actibacterium sp. EMB200-NS6]MBB4021649.1 glycerol-3-phosphate dehydrogenase (NAD(P)+) [Actibacterium naphthalenivorans]